ncbi:hydrogenase accessory protein HypB [Ammonifex degensii KC4]|uniref:Hydrogenase accessory protein HypB n=1 Tax=Ammonifex degensii (strain DSM 10501 / KC4) TaxID=429009 RepID=C9R9V9_AMMDK|nr:hydrogenase nickel incorporation protein HypB [Ammonifex degensii]ACX53088.1 hydrogenase accessory protein HypB [Ammonifex degensii KC4]
MEIKVVMGQRLLRANEEVARKVRERLARSTCLMVNLISSPGAGKTTLLEATLERLRDRWRIGVIEGDVYTVRDAARIAHLEVPVVQINTAGVCHLSASMVAKALEELGEGPFDLIFVENVGNLVCPAEFDLGEDAKVALLSVTEGIDKPAKYPLVFEQAQLVLITKGDLLPYLEFDLEEVKKDVHRLNPEAPIIVTSAKTGEGLEAWCQWLEERLRQKKEAASVTA